MLKEQAKKSAAAPQAAAAGGCAAPLNEAWSAALQQAVQRAAGLALAVVAPDGRLLHLQHDEQSLAEAIGASQGRQVCQWLAGRHWIEELLAGDTFARASGEGGACREVVRVGGTETLLEQTIVPVTAASASGPVLVAMREISDWQRYSIGIEQLSRFYEVTLNTTAEGILGIDAGGAIDFANPAATRLLGWPSEELIGRAIGDILGTDSHRHQPEGIAGEAWFMRRDGEPFVAEFRVSPKQEEDTRQGAVMVFADISTRKAAERELQESNARLHAALQALEATQRQLFQAEKMAAIGQLAAGIAHEINNPLAFVGANLRSMESYAVELLLAAEAGVQRDDAHSSGAAALDLDFLRQDIPALCVESHHGIARIAGIVQNLRTFAQVDSYREWGLADLNVGLESAVNLIATEIGAGVEILRELGELPQIECQPGQINQVFFNLLSNAVRAVGSHGKIWLRSGRAEDEVWLEVADNGCGIAPEHLERLFEPFFTTCAVGQGMGLGLSVAYGIVKRHGGQLSVSNRAGGGSVFRVVLPATLGCGAGAPAVSASSPREVGKTAAYP